HPPRPGVERVLQQLLDHAGRTLDDLASGDLVDDRGRKFENAPHDVASRFDAIIPFDRLYRRVAGSSAPSLPPPSPSGRVPGPARGDWEFFHRFRSDARRPLLAVLLQLAVEGTLADFEDPGGFLAVAIGHA